MYLYLEKFTSIHMSFLRNLGKKYLSQIRTNGDSDIPYRVQSFCKCSQAIIKKGNGSRVCRRTPSTSERPLYFEDFVVWLALLDTRPATKSDLLIFFCVGKGVYRSMRITRLHNEMEAFRSGNCLREMKHESDLTSTDAKVLCN